MRISKLTFETTMDKYLIILLYTMFLFIGKVKQQTVIYYRNHTKLHNRYGKCFFINIYKKKILQ
jgi:hypothetical protein